MKGYIYCVICLPNGKLYFGQTIRSIQKRWARHIRNANHDSPVKFHRAIRKYVEDNFVIEEVMWVEADTKDILRCKLNYLEKYFIWKYNSLKCGYNETVGGEGLLGFKLSLEARIKISNSRKGNLNPNFGKHLSKEHREKIRRAVTGKYKMSIEHKEKLVNLLKGRTLSEATKRKISESKRGKPAWNKGLKCSDTWRLHNSEAQKRFHEKKKKGL